MKLYTVHQPDEKTADPLEIAERIVFVKDGFAWIALLIPALWALWNRMWLVFVGYLLLASIVQSGLMALGSSTETIAAVTVLINLLFALEANNLRRWTLERKGFTEIGAVAGRSWEECEARFFANWVEAQSGQVGSSSRPSAVTSTPTAVPTVGIVGRA